MARKKSSEAGEGQESLFDLAQQIEASLPPPQPKRTERVLVAFAPEEKTRVELFAQGRGEPLATAVRNLTLAALDALFHAVVRG